MRRTWVGVGYAVLLTLTACQARDEARPKPPPANEAATAGRTDLITGTRFDGTLTGFRALVTVTE